MGTHAADPVRPLTGWAMASGAGSMPAHALALDHLARLGARGGEPATGGGGEGLEVVEAGPGGRHGAGGRIPCIIRWPHAPGDGAIGREELTQALSGLMSVHGRDLGSPRPLGLDVVTAAVGLLATQGLLAALIARRRGRPVAAVEVSALRAGTWFIGHHIAAATGGAGWPIAPGGPDADPGPPFPTAEGRWVELEMLSPEVWRDFWRRLEVDEATIGAAWLAFAVRHSTARCSLPRALHAATAERSLAELLTVAESSGAAVVPVRSRAEAVADGDATAAPWELSLTGTGVWSLGEQRRGGASESAGPLAGVRVLEATTRVQGPLAGQLLRLLGCEVTRIEPPGGDPGRYSASMGGAVGASHAAYNRGKRGCEIDYRGRAGRASICDLARESDVFLHNWRPGRAEELGLDAADLHAVNPSLVYAWASGWGRGDARLPPVATDFLVQAHVGLGERLALPGEPPFPSRVTLVDVAGGLVAVEGVLAALLHRELSGHGARVDTSLLSGARALMSVGAGGRSSAAVAVPAERVCADLRSLAVDPPEPALLEQVDGGCWAPAPPWTFTP